MVRSLCQLTCVTHTCAHVPTLRMLLCRYYGDWNGKDGSPEKEVVAETRTPQKRNADGSFKVGGSSSLTSQLEREELCARMTEVSHAKVSKKHGHMSSNCVKRDVDRRMLRPLTNSC